MKTWELQERDARKPPWDRGRKLNEMEFVQPYCTAVTCLGSPLVAPTRKVEKSAASQGSLSAPHESFIPKSQMFLCFKKVHPQLKFMVTYPSASTIIPGDTYEMFVDAFDPQDDMKPRDVNGE